MLSVRASPSPSDSVYDYRLGGGTIGRRDEEPNYESWRKRYLDGSHKGLGLGFDTATCAAPAYNNNRSNGGPDSQRPRALIHAYGKDSSKVSQFQSTANHNLGSRYPSRQASPIFPSRDLSQSSQNLLDAKGRSRNFQIPSQSAMPVPSVGLQPHVKVNKYRPPPLNPPVQPNFAMQQNQKNQGPFIALHLQREALPPLPPGPSPPYLQGTLSFQNPCPVVPSNQPGISAYSGLVSSLLAQGLISLTNQTPPKDSLGVEFKADLLKMRHESVITALYDDIPRQCATCGRRFKCQEEHRRHMDWHVTKNRMSKNHKHNPSRKWFVSTSMCLLAAKALGTDAAPNFMSADTIVEKKSSSDEEMTVPADEDQTSCALCRERFDDFYSHDREEWMYKDAVYFNAPEGSTEGMDRSELGPIVHAKCRPEGSQRKRLRRS